MKPIDHRTAQRWVNARLDGALDLESLQRLEDHLHGCQECQQYAAEIHQLDTGLYREFAGQPQPARLPAISLPPRAALLQSNQARTPMFNLRLTGFVRSAAYIATLVAMVGGLAFLFSNMIPKPVPGSLQPATSPTTAPNLAYPAAYPAAPAAYPAVQSAGQPAGAYPYPQPVNPYPQVENPYPGAYPYPQPGSISPAPQAYPGPGVAATQEVTGTVPGLAQSAAQPAAQPSAQPAQAYPTPPAGALSSPDEIASRLDGLAQKNVLWYQSATWVHILKSSLDLPGSLASPAIESWVHPSSQAGECTQSLTYVRDRPGGTELYQMFVQSIDGLHGDLQAMRQSNEQASQFQLNGPDCQISALNTDAGRLARRVLEDPSVQGKQPSRLRQVFAWEETLDGQPVWVVQATFDDPQASPQGQVETYRFDLQTGSLLQEFQRRQGQDGQLLGLIGSQYQYQVYPTLPEAASRPFEQALAELHQRALSQPPPTPDLTQ